MTARTLEPNFIIMALHSHEIDMIVMYFNQLPPVAKMAIVDAIERAMFDERDGESYEVTQFILRMVKPESDFIDREDD